MKRIAFDSCVLDAIEASPGLLQAIQRAAASGELILVSSHVQEDELAATPDEERRAKLLALYRALPVTTVMTHGFVIGVSRVGMARIGDGSRTGVAIDDLDSKERKHRRDALIGVTAAGEAHVFVTCDDRLRRRMRRAKAPCEVWDFDQFRQYVLSVTESADSKS
jgi:hypothetical protein